MTVRRMVLALGLVAVTCVTAAERKPNAQLRAWMLPRAESDSDARIFRLEVSNKGIAPIAIPKPIFPTRWIVTWKHRADGKWTTEERAGGRGAGTASGDHKNRYEDGEYVIIPRGQSYSIEDDLNWYLGFPESKVEPGVYSIRFIYEYLPTADETDIPILRERLDSNLIKIEVPSAIRKGDE